MPAGDRYVEVPAEAMLSFLKARGFSDAPAHSRWEIVYERAHHVDPRFRVLVYTSIARGNADARGLGKDAIRVVPLYDDGVRRYPIAKKLKRVFRTGSVEKVLERMLERMREAYAIINNRPEVRVRSILRRKREEAEKEAEMRADAEAAARDEECRMAAEMEEASGGYGR